jgi:LuxR family maltose regulon positive regulatory protein
LAAWQARVWLAQGQLEAASQWVGERGLDADRDSPYARETEYITLARILIAQGRPSEATALLDRLLKAAETGGRTSKVIEILNLQALSFQAQDNTDQAIRRLEEALTLAEPEGFIRVFVDEGPPMARLLYEAATRGVAPEYVRRLLAAFQTTDDADADHRRPTTDPGQLSSVVGGPSSTLVEPLSERELEVLQLIAEGLTNREIASRLLLSVNTVKAHARNIYGKLDAHNRTQAVARARALGILPST